MRFCDSNNYIYVQLKYKNNTIKDNEEENNEEILDTYEFFEQYYYGNNQYYEEIILEKLDNILKPLFINIF